MTTDQEKMLDECLVDEDAGFTAWEIDFLESLDRQRGRTLSERQIEVLIKLNAKAIQ